MEKQIKEVHNYFVNRITACQFELVELEFSINGWVQFKVNIDGYNFEFSIEPESKLTCCHYGFMNLNIPNDRISNLLHLIESKKDEANQRRIAKLREELAQLSAE